MHSRTFSRRSKLTTSSEAVCHETFEEDGVEVSASKVNRGGVPSGTRADNDLARADMSALS